MAWTRRDFVSAAAAGIALPALTGCGKAGSNAPKPGSETLGDLEKNLNIYNWSDYIGPEVIPGFEKEFGVKVTYDTYESSEEMVAKLQAGARGYDIVVPTTYAMTTLINLNLLAPLSPKYLTNLGNIAPVFRGLPHDPENKFAVPWQWGMTGIVWRTDLFKTRPDSWNIFLNGGPKGKMTMLDDMRDVIGAFLRLHGYSINSIEPKELEVAKRDAVAAKSGLKAYLSAPVKAQLIAGDVWMAQMWNGDANQAKREQPALEWILPKEGSTLWIDSLAIPAAAEHPRAAHEFMNYILRPEVGERISAFTGYGSPNQAAMPLIKNPVPYPSPDELARLEVQKDLGRASALWDDVWTQIKST